MWQGQRGQGEEGESWGRRIKENEICMRTANGNLSLHKIMFKLILKLIFMYVFFIQKRKKGTKLKTSEYSAILILEYNSGVKYDEHRE